ncbi:MAG: energy transducer TonB [Allosphingosinicella sp.]
MLLRTSIFLTLAATSAAGAAAEPELRRPAAQWVVDFDESKCVASRKYGSEAEPIHLVLKAPPLGDVMQLAVMREGKNARADQLPATIGLDDGPALKTNMLRYTPSKGALRVHLLNMASADFAQVRQAKTLSIRSGGLNETFELSQMEPLLKIMDDCVSDLREVWNVGRIPGEPSTHQKRATGSLYHLFSPNDYPGVSLQQGDTGAVRFVMLVDEAGRVADCTVIETSGVAALDTQSCAVAQDRGRFEPARGADGKPAKDALIQRIVWNIAY